MHFHVNWRSISSSAIWWFWQTCLAHGRSCGPLIIGYIVLRYLVPMDSKDILWTNEKTSHNYQRNIRDTQEDERKVCILVNHIVHAGHCHSLCEAHDHTHGEQSSKWLTRCPGSQESCKRPDEHTPPHHALAAIPVCKCPSSDWGEEITPQKRGLSIHKVPHEYYVVSCSVNTPRFYIQFCGLD